MDKVVEGIAKKKATDLVNHIRDNSPNDYDWNVVMEFANWWVDQHENDFFRREECLRLATKYSPEGTSEEAIVKKANTYYKFIVNN